MTELELLERGLEHHRAGRAREAAECYQQVLRANAAQPDALYLFAVLSHQTGNFDAAVELARRGLDVSGDQPRLHEILGLALLSLDRLDEAELNLVRAAEAGTAQALSNLGILRKKQGRLEEAVAALRRAIGLRPEDAQLRFDLAGNFEAMREFADAAEAYRAGLALDPARPEMKHNFAHMLFELGRSDEALDLFREAAQGPRAALPRAMIAVMIPGAPKATNEEILQARRAFAERDLPPVKPRRPRAPGNPLRIGYVSSFFHRQNWMKPVWPLIARHDRSRFAIHIFSDAAESAMPEGYRADPRDRYHDISALSNEQSARLIEDQAVDLLIDLNGYSKLRRLPLFTLRPAPVIAGWFNMFATTGMSCYDYLIGDGQVVPSEEEAFYCEKIIRAPGSYLTFDVTYPVPEIAYPPYVTSGAVAFGCLAPLYKITPQAIAAWSRILRESPHSSFVLRGSAFKSDGARRYVIGAFMEHGIAPERLRVYGPADHYQFLETYKEIDIALDTFPYNGGTTTTEAIWQGAPVVTFWGDRWVSRTSASILRAGNLGEFVNRDVEGYVRQAIELAKNPSVLLDLRRDMRARLRASPVCDVETFARDMEAIYSNSTPDAFSARHPPSSEIAF